MFSNYFKIALRNLLKQKAFSAVNILGLSIGLTTCLVIMLYVMDELGYDRYSEKWDRIVRVTLRKTQNGNQVQWPVVGPAMAADLRSEFPEIEQVTRIRSYGSSYVSYNNTEFKETRFAAVDAGFFEVFTLPFIEGESKSALKDPNSIVITEAVARKYFGNEEALGKILELKDRGKSFKVTGVIKEIPKKSHFHFDLFIPLSNLKEAAINSWFYFEYYTYLVLPEGYDHKNLEAKLPQVAQKYMAGDVQEFFGMSYGQLRQKGDGFDFALQPLSAIHLYSDFPFDIGMNGDIEYVYIFSAIALFMLLIACINFMNLSTARAAKRAKEVGIRKVLGSVRSALIQQFLSESLLMTGFALLAGLLLLWLALPFFNYLTGKELTLVNLLHPVVIMFILLTAGVVGLLAGSYPAFYLSSFQPIAVLKGQLVKGKKSAGIRSALVVVQFFISTTLIICTLVVFRQLSFIQNKELGYSKEQVIVLHSTGALGKNEKIYKEKLLQNPGIVHAAISNFIPAGPSNGGNEVFGVEGSPEASLATGIYRVDEDYIPVLGMKLLQGRNFSPTFATDSSAVIINESTAREIGGKEVLGKKLLKKIDSKGTVKAYTIIGVVQDFHFESLGQKVRPLVMLPYQNSGSILLKVQPAQIAQVLQSMKKEWEGFSVKEPFIYSFLDERFAATYEKEQKTGQSLGVFAGLTIFIACLGLTGLATFVALQRRKEVGIRKVLGASVGNITFLLSRDFIVLVLIANMIAWPIAWYVMNKWLENFAYHTEIGPDIFIIAGLLALLITLLTVSFQSVKAALANPVESLKNE